MSELSVRSDLSEIVQYTSPSLPIRSRLVRLSRMHQSSAACHWHPELEYVIVREGRMAYFVNGKTYILTPGQGLIVNANRLHFGSAVNGSDCVFMLLVLHPLLLCSNAYTESRYIQPFIQDSGSDGVLLDGEAWHLTVKERMERIYILSQELPSAHELEIQSEFLALWAQLYRNTVEKNGIHRPAEGITTVMNMLSFIEAHYTENIVLKDIAAAGAVCRSKCFNLFRSMLGQAPIEYLRNYRIQKSLVLLADDKKSITDIAAVCGFNGASYFSEVFRQVMGITPSQYRQNLKKHR
ncbi:AraC family transcriptional regulator [Gehongia tenuis]|uniref:AraC family transcriptional regulator n=1 Tax=Gehongia tenuis TaxID=2763655 RepID=A0A926D415_9FIRM|nr:AraC family transcriptional regulator [Gehongia tenuis]MBC8530938.1 AraC family transcriptional regulator [Gehongia tenuis]